MKMGFSISRLMKRRGYLIVSLLVFVLTLNAQDQDVLISGSFQNVPLLSFIETVEQKYPVQFFFERKALDDIWIVADFQETPLASCLESILYRERLNFYISDNNQVTIYAGGALKRLFPEEQQFEVIRKESSHEEKISRDKLKRLQYQS